MKALSLCEAKTSLSALVDGISATGEDVLITKNGRPAAVLENRGLSPNPA